MGVRGLGALLKDKGEHVNLAEFAKQQQQQQQPPSTEGEEQQQPPQQPLKLACDGWALAYWLLRRGQPHADSRLGGQHWALARAAGDFAARMAKAGVALVVVWDGPSGPEKRDELVRRMRDGLPGAAQAWRELWTRGDVDTRFDGARAPLLTRNTVHAALAEAGVECRCCATEADAVIAGMCLRGECRAALSNDSDYFVLGCDYIPLDRIVFKETGEVEARIYTLAGVAEALKVDKRLLPLVANLAGNDYTFTSVSAAAAATAAAAPAAAAAAPDAGSAAAAAPTPTPPLAVLKTAALIAAIEHVQKHEAELLEVVDNPRRLAEVACQGKEDLIEAVVTGMHRYALTDPPPVREELVPLLGSSLLGAALHGIHYSSIVPEDLGSKHPKFSALSPIAEVVRSARAALYALAMGSGKKVEEVWNRRGELAVETMTTGPWPFSDVPEVPLAELRALPEERRRALLLSIFGVDATKVPADAEPFALVAMCMVTFLARHDRDAGLPLPMEDLAALLGYIHDRKNGRAWAEHGPLSKGARAVSADERPFLARGVHLFSLFQQLWSLIEAAHMVLGNPFGAAPPPPQRLFDGASWQVAYNRVRTKGLSGPEQNWATKLVPAPVAAGIQQAVAAIKREQEQRQKKLAIARENSKGATAARSAAAASRRQVKNAYDLLDDD